MFEDGLPQAVAKEIVRVHRQFHAITLLSSLGMLTSVWNEVKSTIIMNCFNHSFSTTDCIRDTVPDSMQSDNAEVSVVISALTTDNVGASLEGYPATNDNL